VTPEQAAALAAAWTESGSEHGDALREAAMTLVPDTEDWALFPPGKAFAVAGGALYQLALLPEGIAVDRWILNDGRTHIGVLNAAGTRTWRFIRRGGHDVELVVVSERSDGNLPREERFARAVAHAAGWPVAK
jgi:hypothetical protein